jgi:hypothetical protein
MNNKKLTLANSGISSQQVSWLLERMEQNSQITDLDLKRQQIEGEGSSFLAQDFGKQCVHNLMVLSLFDCGIGDDGFMAAVSALEQNTSLLKLLN